MTEPLVYQLEIPGTPPSLNTTGASRGWQKFAREKKKWEGFCFIALLEQSVPKHGRHIDASALMRFKDKRRRDEGNFRVILEKALGDALQLGNYIEDDTPEFYSFKGVSFAEETGVPLTVVKLEVYP